MKLTYRIDNEISLRLIEPRHAEELYAVIDANRDAILPWMRWVNEVTEVSHAYAFIQKWLYQTAETGCVSLGIELNDELVGAVFHIRPDMTNKQVEIGYWLASSARGRGVVTRAVRALCDITFRDLGFNRVNVRVAPENAASLAVAERLGCVREGVSRQAWLADGKYWDAVEFGLLAEDWDATLPEFALTHRVDDELELRFSEPRLAKQVYTLVAANRAHLQRWLPWCTPEYSEDEAESFSRSTIKGFADGQGLALWIVYRGKLVGSIGNTRINTADGSAEIGYWLAESAQGNGVVTRAARAVTDYTLVDMGLNRVMIYAALKNTRSQAVPERLGYDRVAVHRKAVHRQGEYVDDVQYAMLAEDWKVNRESGT